MRRTFVVLIVALVFVLTASLLIAPIDCFKFVDMFTTKLFDLKTSKDSLIVPMFRPTQSTVPKWCSSRKGLKTGNSKAPETTALHVIEASKSHLSIVLLLAR
ncbi:hypothetical protein LINPERPRIM_LOCUS20575 [Linum perenne]